MSDFPAAENASPDEICQILDKLKVLLDNLPVQLVEESIERSAFAFLVFYEPDRELLEDLGCEVSVLNVALERLFGAHARSTGDGIVPIKERGPPVRELHTVLADLWNKPQHQTNNVLKKWIIDIASGAEKTFRLNQVPVSTQFTTHSNLVINPYGIVDSSWSSRVPQTSMLRVCDGGG